jgi:hypothetical protein
VIIPLDLTQLSCPGFMVAVGLLSGFTTDRVAARGEPCREPAISLHSHHVSLVQWTTRFLPVTRFFLDVTTYVYIIEAKGEEPGV